MADLAKLVDELSALTVMEAADLSKMLEEKWGVSAAAAVAVAAGGAAAAAEEEKSEFDIILEAAGDNKINVIKEIRAITNLGLKEAKDLVDGAPKTVKEGAPKEAPKLLLSNFDFCKEGAARAVSSLLKFRRTEMFSER